MINKTWLQRLAQIRLSRGAKLTIGLFAVALLEIVGYGQYLQVREYKGQIVYPLFIFYKYTIIPCLPVIPYISSVIERKHNHGYAVKNYLFTLVLVLPSLMIFFAVLALVSYDIAPADSVAFQSHRYTVIRVFDRSELDEELYLVSYRVFECDPLNVSCVMVDSFAGGFHDEVSIFVDEANQNLNLKINTQIHQIDADF